MGNPVPVGQYKIGPVTENDEVLELKMSPTCSQRHLIVGDATQMLVPLETSFWPDIRESLPLLKEMPVYEDDVFIVAHAKTGSHWTWEIISMLVKGSTEYEQTNKARRQLEFHFPDEFKGLPRPRVFNTHFLLHHLPTGAMQKKCKIIVVQRNPKDLLVSLYYHLKGMPGAFDDKMTFDIFANSWLDLEANVILNWFYYTRKLEEDVNQSDAPVYNVYFEDLKTDPMKEVKNLMKHLDIERSDDFIKEVIDKCSFLKLKKADEDLKVAPIEGLPKEAFSHLYRKGEVGDWKNHFTVALNERFDKVYNERMKDSRFTYKYTI